MADVCTRKTYGRGDVDVFEYFAWELLLMTAETQKREVVKN